MTTSKPEVVAYLHTNIEDPEHRGVSLRHDLSCTSTLINTEPLIRLRDYQRLQAESERLQAENDALRAKTSISLGVGDGTGNLFVHGDYDSIKRVQALIFEYEKLRKDVSELAEELKEAYGTLERAVSPSNETPEAAIQGAMFAIEAALAAHRKQGGVL